MREKARQNLAAAAVLQGEGDLSNAVVNRAYYAAYHAVWWSLVDQGETVPLSGGRRYFRHDDLPNRALKSGVLDDDRADDLVELEGLRVTADYYPEDVAVPDAATCVEKAGVMVEELLGPAREAE